MICIVVFNNITPNPSPIHRVIVAVVVVNEAEFGVVILAGPLDGLGDISFCRYLAVGGVGVEGADVSVLSVDFADVLRQVPAVGIPGGVFLDGQRAGGYGLGRVPGDEPECGWAARVRSQQAICR